MEAGVMDSTGVLELVEFLESAFGIEVADSETLPGCWPAVIRAAWLWPAVRPGTPTGSCSRRFGGWRRNSPRPGAGRAGVLGPDALFRVAAYLGAMDCGLGVVPLSDKLSPAEARGNAEARGVAKVRSRATGAAS
jgi:hypothetical protein